MDIKIGIPSGLLDFDYKELWDAFFIELGAQVIHSEDTNRSIMDYGVSNCVAEACLPVKILHGHVVSLKSKVDYLLIPRYTSVSRRKYICPEVGGLPDLVRNSIPDLPEIIDVNINLYKSNKQGFQAAFKAGKYVSNDRHRIYRAYKRSLDLHEKNRSNHVQTVTKNEYNDKIKIALIGHSYILMDEYLNMGIVQKLKSMGACIVMPKDREISLLREKGSKLSKRMFWDFGEIAIGFMRTMVEEQVDGVLFISSFGCGLDAFINYMVEEEVQEAGIPFCSINIDEHSGEAGLETRLEAFTDMIIRRSRAHDYNFSPHRQCLYNS